MLMARVVLLLLCGSFQAYERLEGTFPPEILTQAAMAQCKATEEEDRKAALLLLAATRLSALPSLVRSSKKRGRCATPAPVSTSSERRRNSSSPVTATSGRGQCTPPAVSEGPDTVSGLV